MRLVSSQRAGAKEPHISARSIFPFTYIVSALWTMAIARRVQILLRALLNLLKKATSKAAVPVRILWAVLQTLSPVSWIRPTGGLIYSDSNHHGTTFASFPPLLDSTEAPVLSALTSSSSNVNGAGASPNRTPTVDIQTGLSGWIENIATEDAANEIHMSLMGLEPEVNLQPTLPWGLRRYCRKHIMYVSSPCWVGLLEHCKDQRYLPPG